MRGAFVLTLVVNHACNLRCAYCYTGEKFNRPMHEAVARAAVERAAASLRPGGLLELGFFGGEPLLEAGLVERTLGYARDLARRAGLRLRCSLTTNGTFGDGPAWRVMNDPDVELSVSCDGLSHVHDRHRGRGTAAVVEGTLRRLLAVGRDLNVVMVVRPDTVMALPEGIEHLRGLGVRWVEPTLDLWTCWSPDDVERLRTAVAACAELWREGLPDCGNAWFDDVLARRAGVPSGESARCGFGDGQIAVAPSGRLYPCERLIGEDRPDHAQRLPGSALDGGAFPEASGCRSCAVCPCSNYVRTGSPAHADDLLRAFERMRVEAVESMIGRRSDGSVEAS